jgi:prepilin signal peptidase PulO-like enzyme (type II secretory pathway)
MTTDALAGVAFAIAAWLGCVLGRAYCAGRTGFDDGPKPVEVPFWVIACTGGLIGIGVASRGASVLELSTLAIVLVALAACAVCDFRLGILPDLFTLVPLAALVISAGMQRNFGPLLSAFVTALPFAIIAIASKGRGMGWGDVKLVALGGALLGVGDAIIAFFLASTLAFALSRFRALRGQPIAFGPYLVGGIGAVLMFSARL